MEVRERHGLLTILTDSTETLCGLVSQNVDTFCDDSARVVDDGHACFETQHDDDDDLSVMSVRFQKSKSCFEESSGLYRCQSVDFRVW